MTLSGMCVLFNTRHAQVRMSLSDSMPVKTLHGDCLIGEGISSLTLVFSPLGLDRFPKCLLSKGVACISVLPCSCLFCAYAKPGLTRQNWMLFSINFGPQPCVRERQPEHDFWDYFLQQVISLPRVMPTRLNILPPEEKIQIFSKEILRLDQMADDK